jgi:hypothetical protein
MINYLAPQQKAYLSGPMSGYADYNFPAFNAAAAYLRGLGYGVFNPAENFGGRVDYLRAVYMRADIEQLLLANFVVVLPGWERSKGASLEVAVALELGLPVWDLVGHEVRAATDQATEQPGEKSVLAEAEGLVHGARNADYGHPLDDFAKTGRIWGAILGTGDISPEKIGLCMIGVKLSRATCDLDHPRPIKRDNLVDMAGYTATVEMVEAERMRRETAFD